MGIVAGPMASRVAVLTAAGSGMGADAAVARWGRIDVLVTPPAMGRAVR